MQCLQGIFQIVCILNQQGDVLTVGCLKFIQPRLFCQGFVFALPTGSDATTSTIGPPFCNHWSRPSNWLAPALACDPDCPAHASTRTADTPSA